MKEGEEQGEEVGKGGKERKMRRHKHYDLFICVFVCACAGSDMNNAENKGVCTVTQSNAFIYIHCMHAIDAEHTAVKRASCRFKHKKPRHEDSSLNSNNSWPFRFIWKTVLSSLLPASNLPPTKTHTNIQTHRHNAVCAPVGREPYDFIRFPGF